MGPGCPVRFSLTAGQRGDALQAIPMIENLPARAVIAETAYGGDKLRQGLADRGAAAVIPNDPSRALRLPLDKDLYAQRHPAECCFSTLKQLRRVSTRLEKTARNYLAVITRTTIVMCLQSMFTRPRTSDSPSRPTDLTSPRRCRSLRDTRCPAAGGPLSRSAHRPKVSRPRPVCSARPVTTGPPAQ
jgi:transposase